MIKLVVEGGNPLKGEVFVRGAKNSGFKLMIASLMGKGGSTIGNLTLAAETKIAISVIRQLGGEVKKVGEHTLVINPQGLKKWTLPFGVGKESRSSTLYVPALLYRFGQAKVPWPGGDKIGARPLDRHFQGMKKMGVSIKGEKEWLLFSLKKRPLPCHYRFPKNTHTGTDTLLMLAAFAAGETVLENAAEEPEVNDLIAFLNKMGGKIKRRGRTIIIKGVKQFQGGEHLVIPDRNEAVTFACAALGTRGKISIFNLNPQDLTIFIEKVRQAGGKIKVGINEMVVEFVRPLRATKIETTPHPGFMTDWQSIWFTLMTQARGKSTIIERVYPQRFQTALYLEKMGAKIKFFNPKVKNPEEYYNFNLDSDRKENFHGAYIFGPTKLKGTTVDARDIRTGAALLLAALMAEGKTIIEEAEKIFRGYENLDTRLSNLGGKIFKFKDS